MKCKIILAAVTLSGALILATGLQAQESTTRTNRWGDTVTDTRSLQNGILSNDKVVTTPNGKTFTKDKTDSINSNGRVLTNVTRTGPNGKSVERNTTHGYYGNRTTITGPNGGSRTYYRRR